MKRIIPEIFVENCKEALEYYKEVFGGEIKSVQLADGKPMFKGLEGKIIHSELHINDDCIMYLVDILDDNHKRQKGNLVLELESEEEINRLYSALSKNGSVQFELQKTFWGAYHAVVIDSCGNKWGLNYSAS
ncbi:VOC family protein [uncultured Clostridium sp.]|uniref:VOC family protein n=1 Tax=uncultured Clostridium sp. TaxID=59620 RepID=UPI0028F0155D|nr:VOC family protein [uncultured Clostridium sp.]